ncbi:MAG: type I-B CRISPR-associated endonuclease Cas1 [Phaeodactylibacter sp.]|nr:type I-B CRISPR-associated endonuclease Cas1 [Phaeodactylibacter sp.]
MKKAFYLFNPGRMSRRDNTLKFEPTPTEAAPEPKPRYLPVESVSAFYVFGNLDTNSALYNFLGRKHIPVHFFDYYEHYTGSFSPKEYLLAGQMLVAQTDAYRNKKQRLFIAAALLEAALFNMLKNLKYYQNRGRDLEKAIQQLETLNQDIPQAKSINGLMGLEGNARQTYYSCFGLIAEAFPWQGRRKRPPTDELNALISFGNALCYTVCLDAIYNSQLNPTISYLHEPGARRYSLALDIAEIFKPVLVDRLIFRLCNRKEIRAEHFDWVDQACFLLPVGKKVVVQAWEERLQQSIQHRKLNRKVSYRHLLRLDCYKLAKYLIGMDATFEPFKSWW